MGAGGGPMTVEGAGEGPQCPVSPPEMALMRNHEVTLLHPEVPQVLGGGPRVPSGDGDTHVPPSR